MELGVLELYIQHLDVPLSLRGPIFQLFFDLSNQMAIDLSLCIHKFGEVPEK